MASGLLYRYRPVLSLLGAILVATGAAVLLLLGPAATVWWTSWGPDRPWEHRDLLGALWLWFAEGNGGAETWLARQNWPEGAQGLASHIPNPFDAMVLGPLLARAEGDVRVWWGVTQMAHHLGNVAATVVLARALRCSHRSAAWAGVWVAATPVMLHEVAGGRGLSGVVWPGLLSLAMLMRGNALLAGVLTGVQGLCYLYTGALVGVLALVLRPSLGFVLGSAFVMGPYLASLVPLLTGIGSHRPPADYTSLPLAGVWGDTSVPARFRSHPLLWMGLLAAVGRWRWWAVVMVPLVVALGPTPGAKSDVAVVASPLAWLMVLVPGLGRMHHPIRAMLVAVPLLAVALMRRWPRFGVGLLGVGLWWGGNAMPDAAAWGEARPRAGVAQAVWLRDHASGAIVDLTGAGDAALGLQPLHQRPMLEGLRKPMGAGRAAVLRRGADGWLDGRAQPGLAAQLAAAGFSHVLVVGRREPISPATYAVLAQDLGPPVYPGVYAVSAAMPSSTPHSPTQARPIH